MFNPVNRFSPLSPDVRDNPVKVAAWIVWNVPSFNGPIPCEWTDAVIREAARWGVSISTVTAALVLARKSGHDFAHRTMDVRSWRSEEKKVRTDYQHCSEDQIQSRTARPPLQARRGDQRRRWHGSDRRVGAEAAVGICQGQREGKAESQP